MYEQYFDKEVLIAFSKIEHNRCNIFNIAECFVPHNDSKSTYEKYNNYLKIFDSVTNDNETYDARNIIVANNKNNKNKYFSNTNSSLTFYYISQKNYEH